MRLKSAEPRCFGPSKKVARDGERGFTLIEAAIAIVVMTVAAIAATSLFLYATNYNSGATDRALAAAVAQQQIEQLRALPFSDASLNATTGTTTTVTSAGRSYSVVKTITNTSTTLKTITIQVTPQAAGATWTKTPVVLVTQRASPITGLN